MSDNLKIRQATEHDVPTILKMVQQLAEYEKLAHEVTATEEIIKHNLFTKRQAAEVILAEIDEQPVGMALFFHNFSTFLGKPGIYLEDLFVLPEHRGQGVGKKLLQHLAALTKERDCGRLEWAVLDWNTPAIDFYRNLGAKPMDEWTTFRLTGKNLDI